MNCSFAFYRILSIAWQKVGSDFKCMCFYLLAVPASRHLPGQATQAEQVAMWHVNPELLRIL